MFRVILIDVNEAYVLCYTSMKSFCMTTILGGGV